MSAGKHTPGPWAVKACNGKATDSTAFCYVVDSRGEPLMRGDFCRSEADAALIAAAPELAAALRALVRRGEMLHRATEAELDAARAALAKAGA